MVLVMPYQGDGLVDALCKLNQSCRKPSFKTEQRANRSSPTPCDAAWHGDQERGEFKSGQKERGEGDY